MKKLSAALIAMAAVFTFALASSPDALARSNDEYMSNRANYAQNYEKEKDARYNTSENYQDNDRRGWRQHRGGWGGHCRW